MNSWMFNLSLQKLSKASVLLVAMIAASACAPQSNVGSANEASGFNSQSGIVGGQLATADFQKEHGIVNLAILAESAEGRSQATCTGSLIARNLVLTAAHCLMTPGITHIAAIFTTDERQATEATLRFAADATIHEAFTPGSTGVWNDIAIIKLHEDAPADMKLARLPRSSAEVQLAASSKLILAGFGITNAVVRKVGRDPRTGRESVFEVPSEGSGVLRKIENISVLTQSADKKEITLDQSSSTGACHGDSGGPAYAKLADGTLVVVGVTSRGTNELGNCNEKAIYTGVQGHLEWIANASAALQAAPAAQPQQPEEHAVASEPVH